MEETTVIVEENATESTDIFATITDAFQKIIDFILGIIDMIRSGIEGITGK